MSIVRVDAVKDGASGKCWSMIIDGDDVEGEAGMEAFIEFVPRPTQQLETYLSWRPDWNQYECHILTDNLKYNSFKLKCPG